MPNKAPTPQEKAPPPSDPTEVVAPRGSSGQPQRLDQFVERREEMTVPMPQPTNARRETSEPARDRGIGRRGAVAGRSPTLRGKAPDLPRSRGARSTVPTPSS